MRQEQFTLSTTVSADLDTTFQFLCDYDNHRHLHPYFEASELIGSGVNAAGEAYQDFIITDHIPFLFFHYKTTFPTRQIITAPHIFRSEVQAVLNTNLVNVMSCEEENGRTLITETVTIQASWLAIRYVKRKAFEAHSRTFALLPTVLGKWWSDEGKNGR